MNSLVLLSYQTDESLWKSYSLWDEKAPNVLKQTVDTTCIVLVGASTTGSITQCKLSVIFTFLHSLV